LLVRWAFSHPPLDFYKGASMVAALPARRALLRKALDLAGGLAATAVFAPRRARAQIFTATSISQAAQDARRDVGRLARRADNLLRLTVTDGPDRAAAAVRRFRAEQISLARELAAVFNGRVSEDDWLLVVPTRELDLVFAMQPLVIRLAPTAQEVEAMLKQPLPHIEPQPSDEADDVLLAIVLAALELRTDTGLTQQLKGDDALAAALIAAAGAVKTKRYGLAAFELERLMRVLVLPRSITAITRHSGSESRRTLYKALVVRFVPFVGWTFFVTLLLAAIYDNRDPTAPVLR
jgi:hypothetical protein